MLNSNRLWTHKLKHKKRRWLRRKPWVRDNLEKRMDNLESNLAENSRERVVNLAWKVSLNKDNHNQVWKDNLLNSINILES